MNTLTKEESAILEYIKSKSEGVDLYRLLCDRLDASYNIGLTLVQTIRGDTKAWIPPISKKEADASKGSMTSNGSETFNLYQARVRHGVTLPVVAEAVDPATGMFHDLYEIDVSQMDTIPDISNFLKDPLRDGSVDYKGLVDSLLYWYWRYGTGIWFLDFPSYAVDDARYDQGTGKYLVPGRLKQSLDLRPFIVLVDPRQLMEVSQGPAQEGDSGGFVVKRLRYEKTSQSYAHPVTGVLGNKESVYTFVTVISDTEGSVTYMSQQDSTEVRTVSKTPPQPSWAGHGVLMGAMFTDALNPNFPFLGVPPFLELANIQLELMNAEADNGYTTAISQIPLLAIKGFTGLGGMTGSTDTNVELNVGVSVIQLPAAAEVSFVEVAGTAAAVAAARIDRLVMYAETVTGHLFAGTSSGKATATSQVLSTASTQYWIDQVAKMVETELNRIVHGVATMLAISPDLLKDRRIQVRRKGTEDPSSVLTDIPSDTPAEVVAQENNKGAVANPIAQTLGFSKQVTDASGAPA